MLRWKLNINDKKLLVNRIGELTGERPRYTFMPRCAYEIGAYTVEKNGDLIAEQENVDAALIQRLLDEGLVIQENAEEEAEETVTVTVAETSVEDVSEEDIRPEMEQVAQMPAEEPTEGIDGLTISVPMTRHTAESLRRLINLIYSRGPLLSKATGGQFGVEKDLLTVLDEAGLITSTSDFIALVKENGGTTGLSFEDDKISFTGFPMTYDTFKSKAFQELCCLMNKHALEQKRVQAKVVNDDNEKYAFRIWLLRIGMNGDEFKTSRKILLENLSGHTAFRTKEEEAKWKARQKKKREELKAAKAAHQAENTMAETQPDAV